MCPRPAAGSAVERPADLTSKNGVLKLKFNYFTSVDDAGRTLFCFVTPHGDESPTLHVNPGDTIKLSLTNMVPAAPGAPAETMSNTADTCGDPTMSQTSVNLHFHGTNASPKCHSDEVIHTLINSGESFTYTIRIPADEPPGFYWYHPHVHTLSETALLGGASGIIEVMGIANLQPAVAGLPERIPCDARPGGAGNDGARRLPAVLGRVAQLRPGFLSRLHACRSSGPPPASRNFWRVTNASASTIADLEVKYDGKAQPLQVAALDGVPTGSQDGKRQGTIITQKDILVPPGGRAEFIVTMPTSDVRKAEFLTKDIATDITATAIAADAATIQASTAPLALPRMPKSSGPAHKQRFEDLADAKATAQRPALFL